MQLERRRQDEVYNDTRTSTTTSASLGPAPLPPDFSGFQIQQQARVQSEQQQTTSNHVQESSSNVSTAQLTASQDLLASLSIAQDTFVNVLHQLIRSNLPGLLPGSSGSISGHNGTSSTSIEQLHTNGLQGSGPRTQQVDRLATLSYDLRHASELLHDPFSREMQQVPQDSTDSTSMIHDIKQLLDRLAPQFSNTKPEAKQTARALGSLLGCLDRLRMLYEASPTLASNIEKDGDQGPSVAVSAPAVLQGIDSEAKIYESLQREAKNRQYSSARMARNDSHDSANAVRAVEEAEAELLWGRVDDLLELLSELKTSEVQVVQNGAREHRKGVETTLVGPTPAMATDESTFTAQHMLPEYSSLEPPEYAAEGELEYPLDGKDSLEDGISAHPRRLQRVTTRQRYPTDEKMQLDLDRMTSAIERLYTASPQLANQRVDTVRPLALDRAALREAQLARLGTAIERLGKGRLEDQRAALSPNQTVNGKESTGIFGFLSSSGTVSSSGKGKAAENSKQQSLEKLLNDIDKAASRTMDDQRVSISARQRDAISSARQTAQAAAQDLRSLDREELAFREHLLDSVSKGRLTGQDAVFTLSSSSSHSRASAPPNVSSFGSRLVTQRRSVAHPIDDNVYADHNSSSSARARASSVGGIPPVPPMPTEHAPKSGKEKEPTVKKRFSVSRLLSAKDGNSLQSRNKQSSSRPTSMHASDSITMHYIVEEMRNLGSLIVRVWDDRFEQNDVTSEASLAQEAWSAKCLDATTLQLATNHEAATIRLASPTSQDTLSTKSLDFIFKSDHFELRLPTADSTHSTRSREDLEIATPYRASVFKKYSPTSLVCSNCGAQMADLTQITRYNDLPSEHWAELLDAWMCHHDQTLSEELVAKGNNIWPKGHQALLSSGAVVLAAENVRSWTVADDIEATLGADGHWKSVRCEACRSLIGKSSSGPRQDPSATPAYIRLFKYAIQPASRSKMPTQPLSAHITSTILETSLAMAIHRFVIEDAEQGVIRLVLWLFNPSIRISSSNTSLSTAPTINAVKILYRVGNDLDEQAIANLMGNTEYETLSYPSRICSQMTDMLELSTHIYPKSQQRLGEWSVGWLERSTDSD